MVVVIKPRLATNIIFTTIVVSFTHRKTSVFTTPVMPFHIYKQDLLFTNIRLSYSLVS